MNASFEFLETTTPMITMPSEKVQYFLHFIFKNKWEITQIIEGYYVKDADEVVFNGKLEEKVNNWIANNSIFSSHTFAINT